MVKEFIIGTKYYLKIDIAQMELDIVNNPNEMISFTFDGGAKARFDNGSWISQGSYNYILLRVTGNPNQQAIFVGGTWHNLSDYNVFEIVGNLRSTQQALLTSNNYKLMLRSAIDNPVEFHLYNVNGKFNDAQKLLNNDKDYFGVFKEETDILNPIILIESDSFITSNYAYIQSYNRYYFITDITCVRKNLYRLSLKVDVLKTWYRDIRDASEGLIVRSGNSELYGNGELVDDRLPLKDKPSVEVHKYSPDGNRENVVFTSEPNENTTYCIAVTVMNDANLSAISPYGMNKSKPHDTDLPNVGKWAINNPTLITYFLTPHQYLSLAKQVKNRDALLSYIVNVVFYPFDCKDIDGVRDGQLNLITAPLLVNDTQIVDMNTSVAIETYFSVTNVSSYLVLMDTFSSYGLTLHGTQVGLKFLDYEPYSTYKIYVPYHGWEDVTSYDFLYHQILLYYITDYSSGLSRWYLYNDYTKEIIKSGLCELGFRIGINSTNMMELNRQKQTNATTTALGVLGSVAGVAMGAISGNPIMAVGGAIGMWGSIIGGATKNAMLIEQGNVSTGGDGFGYYTGNSVCVKHTYREMIDSFDYSEYITENGLPVNEFSLLDDYGDSEMRGYIEITSFHMSASLLSITKTEMDEIESLLKTGVFL